MRRVILSTMLALTLSVGTSAFAEDPRTGKTTPNNKVIVVDSDTESLDIDEVELDDQGTKVNPVDQGTQEDLEIADDRDKKTVVEPGMTPDKFIYICDLLMENLKLLVTFDPEKESELLLQFAQERLAEAEVMTKVGKKPLVEQAVADYLVLLEELENKITEVITNEGVTVEVKDELTDVLEETTVITGEVLDQLSPKQQVEVKTKTDQAFIVAQVVAGFDVEVVKKLKEQELDYGQMAKIISLSNISGKSIEEVTSLLKGKMEFGQVMKELSVNIHEVKQQRVAQKIGSVEVALESAQASGNAKSITKLEKQLETLNKKNDRFLVLIGTAEPAVAEGTTESEEKRGGK